jgi:DNA adenine methylase
MSHSQPTPKTRRLPVLNPKPPLKWAGGKRWLVPHLEAIWAPFRDRRFVEPLCGGLAVVLGLSPERALLNDVNQHLINFYRWLQKGLTIDIPMENDSELFYAHRSRFNDLLRNGKAESREAAEIFYFLNRTGFNGLCRFNSKGEFNVPFGRYKRINYKRDFSELKRAFSPWAFTAVSFEKIPLDSDDFVYADPPYDVPFTQYSTGGFEWEQQVKLAEWLAQHRGPVALSNQATDRIVGLYRKLGFELTFLPAPRMISCTGDRTPAKEILALRGM